MRAVTLTPAGPFSLASGIRFLEGFGPANYRHATDGILRLAFPTDDCVSVVAAAVRQEVRADGGTGTVRAEFTVHPGTPHPAKAVTAEAAAEQTVGAQLARILSLDVDATGFPSGEQATPTSFPATSHASTRPSPPHTDSVPRPPTTTSPTWPRSPIGGSPTAAGSPCGEAASGHGAAAKTRWRSTATAATFRKAVRENEEVVPVNAVSTWVLPSGVTVGR